MYLSSGRGPQPLLPTPSVFDETTNAVSVEGGRSTRYSNGIICSSVYGSAAACNNPLGERTITPGTPWPVTAAHRTSSWLPASIGFAYGVICSATELPYIPTSNPRLRSA